MAPPPKRQASTSDGDNEEVCKRIKGDIKNEKKESEQESTKQSGNNNNNTSTSTSNKLFSGIGPRIDGPSQSTIMEIPSHMIPGTKHQPRGAQMKEDHAKPQNWVMPERERKLTRDEVFKTERLNLEKTLVTQQAWSRAARTLTAAIKPKEVPTHPIIPDTEEDDPLNQPARLSNDSDKFQVRKNHSKEFLQYFFKRANSIAESDREEKKKQESLRVIKKVATRKSRYELVIEP